MVRYEYTFQSKAFVGEGVRSANIVYNWSGPAERMCARYPQGAAVAVFLDSSDPSRAVLEPGGSPGFGRLVIVVAAVMMVFALLMLAGTR